LREREREREVIKLAVCPKGMSLKLGPRKMWVMKRLVLFNEYEVFHKGSC
jgi:hypothetical protein